MCRGKTLLSNTIFILKGGSDPIHIYLKVYCENDVTVKYSTTQGLSFENIFVALKRAVCLIVQSDDLGTLPTDTAGKLDVLWHDGDTLGVDRAQVGVLKETDQVGLASLLECHHG
jgi:hypothetical protein